MPDKFRLRVNRHGGVVKSGGHTTHFKPAEIREQLQDKTITSMRFKQTDGKESTILHDWLKMFIQSQEEGTSPHGERVLVTLLPGSHFRRRWFRKGWHLRVRFEAHTESAKSVFDKGQVQMLIDRNNGYTNWIEVVRCLVQCVESGASAVGSDEEDLHIAFMGTLESGGGVE